jgi:hypothetical protein
MKLRSSKAVLAAILAAAVTAHAEEIFTLTTRDKVTESFLLSTPAETPAAVAILFPGGAGSIRLRNEGGSIKFGEGNFLVRARQEFVKRGIASVVVDSPSDQPRGMDDDFRLSEKHSGDVARLMQEVKQRFPSLPVFLDGTSRGTISAAASGSRLGNELAGVVLTSSLFLAARDGPGLSKFDYSTLKPSVLLVHHAEDACRVTPYREARTLADNRRYPLITVHGGSPPTSGPCDPFSAHGYLGKERETVDAIVKWMLKQSYPTDIE